MTAAARAHPHPDTPPGPPRVKLASPTDLVACVPYLLGFHPAHSVVVVAVHDGQVRFGARGDLVPGRAARRAATRHLLDVVTRQQVSSLAVLGYGPAAEVDDMVREVRAAAVGRGLRVLDTLRVTGRRWFSYDCHDPRCCPPEGTPFDIAATEVAAQFTYSGAAAVPDRAALAARVAPLGGSARAAMTRATSRAATALAGWLEAMPEAGRGRAMLAEGTAAVRAAITRYADGGRLDDDEAARLTVLLCSITVRDVAWQAITSEQPHLALWTDVVRRCDPELVAAPACLLAFTAWRSGDGALASLALERALRQDPAYPLAHLLRHGLDVGLPPAAFDGWGEDGWGSSGAGSGGGGSGESERPPAPPGLR